MIILLFLILPLTMLTVSAFVIRTGNPTLFLPETYLKKVPLLISLLLVFYTSGFAQQQRVVRTLKDNDTCRAFFLEQFAGLPGQTLNFNTFYLNDHCFNEQAVYTPGYNWISFPKLDRPNDDPVDAQTLLSGIDPFPDNLTLWGLPPQSQDKNYKRYFDQTWSGNLNTVQSTRGYKLELPDESSSYTLDMTGTRLDPSTSIDVYTGYENWVGYFLQQSLSPMDAFSDLLPDLDIAKGYDWTLMNWSMSANNPVWMVVPVDALIKYGDMAVVTVITDRSFQWYQYGQRNASGQISQPEYFSYTEQADYTPIIIQLDGEDQPEEIGAFVNDTCIGACTVKPSDTLVLVRGYMEGNPDDSVSFQVHYSTKSTGKTVKEYFVFNREKQINERRSIKVGEHKPFYLVSFSEKGKPLLSNGELSISVFPNPADRQINIGFILPEKGDVSIEMFDLIGRVVYRQDGLYLQAGSNRVTINTGEFKSPGQMSGLFFIKINASGITGTAKLLVK